MAKAKICSRTSTENGTAFNFSNGEVLEVSLDDLSPEIVTQLAQLGLNSKVGDSYAGVKDAGEAHGKASTVWTNLVDGKFTAGRTSTGGGAAKSTMLAEAVQRATGRSEAEVIEMIDSLDDDQKKALQQNDAVKHHTAVIKAERAAAKVAAMGEAPAFTLN